MTSLESPPTETGLAAEVRKKLHEASGPLKLTEVVKGLPKQKGVKPAQLKESVKELLEEEARLGRVFSQDSGKNRELRYWSHDERQHLRDKAVELASIPLALSVLKAQLGKAVKGVDGQFVVALVRDLINDDRLHEHPHGKKNGQPLLGAFRPRPLDKHKKAMDKLLAECNKLLTAAHIPLEDLLQAIRNGIGQETSRLATSPDAIVEVTSPLARQEAPASRPETDPTSLECMILKAVAENPVVSLATLRAEMPKEYQGQAFDDSVLRLVDDFKVTVSKDADPSRFSEQEAATYVRDGSHLYTTIMARS